MANIALNTAYIRGTTGPVKKVIEELERISYCTDFIFEEEFEQEDEEGEYQVIFGSKWSEPKQLLAELTTKYEVEIVGSTNEFGCCYFARWFYKHGEEIYHDLYIDNLTEERITVSEQQLLERSHEGSIIFEYFETLSENEPENEDSNYSDELHGTTNRVVLEYYNKKTISTEFVSNTTANKLLELIKNT